MMQPELCHICGESSSNDIYLGPIRAGRFGALTSSAFRVVRCVGCGVDRLDPIPADPGAYESGVYRATVDGDSDAAAYYMNHDSELAGRLSLIGTASLRGKVIADIGCGAGAFLDMVKGLASRTIGVEPQRNFGPVLIAKNHGHYPYAHVLAAAEPNSVDIAFSFQVIEHVPDPLQFLKDVSACIKPGGMLHLTTPNRNDILMLVGNEAYRRFFYRIAHFWYFDAASLREVARRAGFTVKRFATPYRYDLSNFVVWLRDGRPSGVGAVPELHGIADAAFRSQVEASGKGDIIYVVLGKD